MVLTSFNPRARMGRDEKIGGLGPAAQFQSTRPYGARRAGVYVGGRLVRFQSTRPYGARPLELPTREWSKEFQSTRPYGARRARNIARWAGRRFNPRARMGRDESEKLALGQALVSIHAPVWGATRPRAGNRPRDAVSIHAPVWGATKMSRRVTDSCVFQSTRPYGARRS